MAKDTAQHRLPIQNLTFLDEYLLPTSGQTAMWKYKAIYIEEDIEIGNMSNELTVNVAGML